jgi:hypothetical protein
MGFFLSCMLCYVLVSLVWGFSGLGRELGWGWLDGYGYTTRNNETAWDWDWEWA